MITLFLARASAHWFPSPRECFNSTLQEVSNMLYNSSIYSSLELAALSTEPHAVVNQKHIEHCYNSPPTQFSTQSADPTTRPLRYLQKGIQDLQSKWTLSGICTKTFNKFQTYTILPHSQKIWWRSSSPNLHLRLEARIGIWWCTIKLLVGRALWQSCQIKNLTFSGRCIF